MSSNNQQLHNLLIQLDNLTKKKDFWYFPKFIRDNRYSHYKQFFVEKNIKIDEISDIEIINLLSFAVKKEADLLQDYLLFLIENENKYRAEISRLKEMCDNIAVQINKQINKNG